MSRVQLSQLIIVVYVFLKIDFSTAPLPIIGTIDEVDEITISNSGIFPKVHETRTS